MRRAQPASTACERAPLRRDRQRGARRTSIARHCVVVSQRRGTAMLSGTLCTVHSLKARPELNGRRAVVVSQLDEGGRVGVQVEGEDKPLSLKPASLDVVSAPPASSRAVADSAVQSVDSKTLARFVAAHSIRASDEAKRLFAVEMRAGVALGGSWCCSTSTLWCVTCAANLAYSGLEDEISDNIPKLLGLPACTAFRGERKLQGELEAALHIVERVADGRKPIGRAPLPPHPLSPSPLRSSTRARAFRQKSASITSPGRSTRTLRRCCSPPAARMQPACSPPAAHLQLHAARLQPACSPPAAACSPMPPAWLQAGGDEPFGRAPRTHPRTGARTPCCMTAAPTRLVAPSPGTGQHRPAPRNTA